MTQARPREAIARIERLIRWWGNRPCSAITGTSCRAYAEERRSAPAARRDLEDLRAALQHGAREGVLEYAPAVTLPARNPARERWLTRSELARLIWSAWRYREAGKAKGRRSRQHIARFALVAYYTGTRAGAVCAASRSQIDLAAGVFYRRPEGEAESKKRRPPVPLAGRLIAHIERWFRLGIARRALIEHNHRPVRAVRKAFGRAAESAGLDGVTPHVLRHTAATHLMQRGASIEDAARLLGMTPATIRATYWHHHAEHARGTAELLARPTQRQRNGQDRPG